MFYLKDEKYNKVFKSLVDKFRLFEKVKETFKETKCTICGKKISDLGISRIHGVCSSCVSLSLK